MRSKKETLINGKMKKTIFYFKFLLHQASCCVLCKMSCASAHGEADQIVAAGTIKQAHLAKHALVANGWKLKVVTGGLCHLR